MFGRSLFAVFAVVAVASGCGGGSESYASIVDKAKNDKKLVIGVKADQPGLGLRTPDGSFTGFDVEVAKYVAKQLGVEPSGITFKETVSANREAFIEQGQVDMVVATYSITDARKQKVSFAGPYFVAGQDLLVRADDTALTGPEALNGKKLCSVAGSTPAQKVKAEYAKEVQLQEERTYSACVDRVLGGQLDAITTDNVILAGYAAQHTGKLKVVGKTFSTEKYGIGLKKDDTAGRKAINDALEKMFSDGSWTKALQASVGASGFALPQAPQLERY
ncbi:Glutamate-binding protein of ABC transporter system [[Actinomadura] parvosata subsp. kistnae]|uniref:Glutamate-binding protein n=2 Tax=Nonomuraea TaxID=83681 RepID=A0A1V0A2A1_9ACTN|nr:MULTISPECIES: glutamate ABC transporter substrate-binding protein [unclassified Nonomuraea]AQZ64328.1 glutamate-binding protein [Nonomuraea sp. ATCC 55076]NJP88322.1 glutamate ABC transporter substrate-binding protein [Nonomuraea sp. FMUSA5-5]SPL89095.1 Glutamate-binding protein of ABC transporter system [Actinomadura parvosata subsp. kistnae]